MNLGHALPCRSAADHCDVAFCDAEYLGYRSMRLPGDMSGSDLAHILRGKLVHSVVLALWGIAAPLCKHVCIVVGSRSKKQMARTHTQPIVAMMQYADAERDWPVLKSPRNTMCKRRHSWGAVHTASAKGTQADRAVSVSALSGHPLPTFAASVNLRPETFEESRSCDGDLDIISAKHVGLPMAFVSGSGAGVSARSGAAIIARIAA